MVSGKFSPEHLNCNSGLDRLSIVLKVEKWLAEYRYFKVKYLQKALFEMDFSIQKSKLPVSELKRLSQISKKLPVITFTSKRVQFKNEEKVLRKALKEFELSYNKKRDCYSVSENYSIPIAGLSKEEVAPNYFKNLIWASIALFTVPGTGQYKLSKRLGRQRSFVNRKLKENPFLFIQRRTVELMTRPKGFYNNVAKENIELFSKLKNNGASKGILMKTQSRRLPSGKSEKYISIYKILPNGYKLKSKKADSIIKSNKKTFFNTKRESNNYHFNSLNGRSDGNGNLDLKSSNDKLKSSATKALKYFDSIQTTFEVQKKNGSKIKLESQMEVMKKPNRTLSFQLKNLTFINLELKENNYLRIKKNIR